MKKFSTILIMMFLVVFWFFRIIVTITTQYNNDFGGVTSLNVQFEIGLLFVDLICFILIAKRKLLGGLIYLIANGAYFGMHIYNNILPMINGEQTTIGIYANLFVSFIAMILALAVFIDLLADKGRKVNPVDKENDWFFKNEQFDRKYDDRADRNQYKF